MIVTAKNWLNYNGTWHKCGERFEIKDSDFESVADYVEGDKEGVSNIFPPDVEQPKPEQPKRGRRKKTVEK